MSSVRLLQGLVVLRGFVPPAQRRVLFDHASALSQRASRIALDTPGPSVASAAHNVNSEEKYKSIALPLDEGTATCEHFPAYADGHELTYFRSRIPNMGVPGLLSRLEALPAVRSWDLNSGKYVGGYAIPELRHLTGQADEIMLEAIGRIDLLPEIQYAHARMYKSTGISATTLRKLPFEVEV